MLLFGFADPDEVAVDVYQKQKENTAFLFCSPFLTKDLLIKFREMPFQAAACTAFSF